MRETLYPLRFEPIFKTALWGGDALRPMFGQPPRSEPEGEAWVLSDQGDNSSRVLDGPLAGKTLRDLMAVKGRALVGDVNVVNGRFPLLLKFLDARQPLSVQVHPNDEQAKRLEPAGDGFGKTEAWLVLRSAADSLLYAGLRQGIGRAEFRDALRGGRLPDVMHAFAPRPGDCVFLNAGVIHAIGAGLMLFEVQQTSDITYRLYDWGRVDAKTGKPRQLHVEQALQCTDVDCGPCHPVVPTTMPGQDRERLVGCRYFSLNRIQSAKPFQVGAAGECRIVVVVTGRATVHHDGRQYPLHLGDVLLLPAAIGPGECVPDAAATVLEIGVR
jgi:mannose-6-phosphate isomerase